MMKRTCRTLVGLKALLAVSLIAGPSVVAQEAKKDSTSESAPTSKDQEKAAGLPEPQNLTRLSPDYDIWIDTKRKFVVVDGKVILREGMLEMFACPKGTKEHESLIAVNCNAQFVHAGLVAVGAEPGRPVAFVPEYRPATGPVIDIWILWKDEQGQNRKVRAQEWVQHTKTGKELAYSWVFAGSGIYEDETTGKKYYMADGGDFICVSNFPSATLDLPVESSQSNAELTFRPFTERIPPLGTPVRLVLQPSADTPSKPAAETKAKSADAKD